MENLIPHSVVIMPSTFSCEDTNKVLKTIIDIKALLKPQTKEISI